MRLPIYFCFLAFLLLLESCSDSVSSDNNSDSNRTNSEIYKKASSTLQLESFTDSRDGVVYKTVTVNARIWMAENLRYNSEGSMLNPENPTKDYGRIYTIPSLKNACPSGWRLPSDSEWDELEMAHGMPSSFLDKGGWRGEHAVNLKASTDWKKGEAGRDSLGFRVLPAGYYFSGDMGGEKGIQGLGHSAAFWSSTRVELVSGDRVSMARFMFGEREFVNKWEDTNGDSGAGLSCRCVKE